MANLWTVEYSFNQNQYTTLPLSEVLSQNLENKRKGIQHDFVPIGVAPNKEAAEVLVDILRRQESDKIIYTDIYGNVIVQGEKEL